MTTTEGTPRRPIRRVSLLSAAVVGAAIALSVVLGERHKFGADQCHEVRGGLDIGSGSTKLLVAEVNVCLLRLEKILIDETEKVEYEEDFKNSSNKTLSPAIVAKGLEVLKVFREKALSVGAKSLNGYATASFRSATNGQQIVAGFARELEATLRVITQDEEALVGQAGVRSLVDTPSTELFIWDIGGGSQEMLAPSRGTVAIYRGVVASVGFKDLVLRKIKGLDPAKVKSPNPMTPTEVQVAVQEAQLLARSVPQDIRRALLLPNMKVIGIGGVHWFSVRAQTGAHDSYSPSDIEQALAQQAGKRDDEIKTKYADTEVTNLALVLGFMRELGIKSVHPLKVNLALGALFNPL